MKRRYRDINLSPGSLAIVQRANQIIAEYQELGYVLTLRQLYYRFVAGGFIPNKDSEYDRLGSIIGKARYAGLVDWDAIEDRTRNLGANSHWDEPADIIDAAARGYAIDKWQDQDNLVEVWVEKEALAGIVSQVCRELDVNWMACRGYMSASEMRVAALRMIEAERDEARNTIILHLGDHDPSGIDMTRDIQDRLREFCEAHGQAGPAVRRIALNMDQVDAYQPPPNPAKLTDSRCAGYMARFGDESWELDALPPNDLADLIRNTVAEYRDDERFEAMRQREAEERENLTRCSEQWEDVVARLEVTP